MSTEVGTSTPKGTSSRSSVSFKTFSHTAALFSLFFTALIFSLHHFFCIKTKEMMKEKTKEMMKEKTKEMKKRMNKRNDGLYIPLVSGNSRGEYFCMILSKKAKVSLKKLWLSVFFIIFAI